MLRRTSLTGALLVGGALLIAAPAAVAKPAKTTKVKVMTRNVFLGGDLIPIAVAQPGADFEAKAGALLDTIDASDPKGRMKLIADEIADAKPDLVGLQEVSTYYTGPKDGAENPATTLRYDFLALIRKELRKRHQHYTVATKRQGLDVEGPTNKNLDVRLRIGDVTLARKGVKFKHAKSGVFKHQLSIGSPQLGPISPARSWNSLDATVRGASFHFVNTHLEAYDPASKLAQAKELVKGALKSKKQTVLVGDLNSGPKVDDKPPYRAVANAGFKPRRSSKNSCCFNDDLRSGGWDHNVDWIMTTPKIKLVKSTITGRETTPGGVHPSDHGGVVSTLRLKR